MMVVGCTTDGCDGFGMHTFKGKELCCECYMKLIISSLEQATETTHDWFNLCSEVEIILEAIE